MNTREVARRYRLNQWAKIISECRSSGQTVKA
ncbi:MAG: IS66 family insertion sequence element accessory protein TnpB, partial [Firmicutes bacterium]|nr:IS66 family insertion sequence element accessory protein TnpB [Bacillota bacterium]